MPLERGYLTITPPGKSSNSPHSAIADESALNACMSTGYSPWSLGVLDANAERHSKALGASSSKIGTRRALEAMDFLFLTMRTMYLDFLPSMLGLFDWPR